MSNRITIYIPPYLRAEMDTAPEVNWSRVAQKAFREELAKRQKVIDEQYVAVCFQ